MQETPDNVLIERCRLGDREAFNHLMLRYQSQVYRVAFRMLGRSEDAEDIAQEVFLKMFHGISTFRGDSKISTWLYRITSNLCLNFLRTSRVSSWFSLDDIGSMIMDEDPLPDAVLERRELRSLIAAAVQKLPPKQRSVFVLRFTEELSYEEIRQILGGSLGGLKANYFHAIRKIEEEVRHALLSGTQIPA